MRISKIKTESINYSKASWRPKIVTLSPIGCQSISRTFTRLQGIFSVFFSQKELLLPCSVQCTAYTLKNGHPPRTSNI